MASHMKGKTQPVNWAYSPRQSHLPPKSPFPSMGPTFVDYSPSPYMGQKSFPHGGGGYRQHQRTTSESFLIEEQPSWLDDLLNEPETPVKKGSHRRSASDSVAFLEFPSIESRIENIAEEEEFDNSNIPSLTLRGSSNFDRLDKENRASNSYQAKMKKPPIRSWDSAVSSGTTYKCGSNSARENRKIGNLGTSSPIQDAENATTSAITREEPQEHEVHNAPSLGLEGKDFSHSKSADPDMDPKRAKQIVSNRQFAQRSRVRKLQYISELERNVSALQTEESKMSAEVSFLNQQRKLLRLENQALKQRITGLAKEQMIKDAEHDLLMSEVQRLKLLYQQQQYHQHTSLQSSKLNVGNLKQADPKSASGSGGFGLVKQMEGLSLGVSGNDDGMTCRNGSSDVFKGNIPSACMIAGTGKKLDGRR